MLASLSDGDFVWLGRGGTSLTSGSGSRIEDLAEGPLERRDLDSDRWRPGTIWCSSRFSHVSVVPTRERETERV